MDSMESVPPTTTTPPAPPTEAGPPPPPTTQNVPTASSISSTPDIPPPSSSQNPNPNSIPSPIPTPAPPPPQQNPPTPNPQSSVTPFPLQQQQQQLPQQQQQQPPSQQQQALQPPPPQQQLQQQQALQPPPPQQLLQPPQQLHQQQALQQPPPPQQLLQPPPQQLHQQQALQQAPPHQKLQQQQALQPPPPQQQLQQQQALQPPPPQQLQQQQALQPPPPQQQPQQQQHTTLQQAQARPQLNRARPPQPHYSQFTPHIPSQPSPSTSTAFSPSLSTPTTTSSVQRGGLAIGVPAHQQRPSQPAPFSTYGQSSFNTQYGGVGRNVMNVPDSTASQVKPPIQVQTIGNFGSLTGSQMRPGGVPSHNQPRALQSSMRSQATPTNQSLPNQQKFPSHSLLRAPPMGSASSPSPTTPQVLQTQPWMAGPVQGKQQMQPSHRQQIKPPTLQQRSHLPQPHHHPMPAVPHQQVGSSQQQQQQHQQQQQQQQQQPLSQLHQSQEHYGQQYPAGRVQSMPTQQHAQRGLTLGSQKTLTATAQGGAVQSGLPNTASNVDAVEASTHIISKTSIHELVSQIDPLEKLDPEVEDILLEIAEDFVDSITTVGCSLAKHRKSKTLEAKDILLHLERNWHMTLPGFGGDEIKGFKRQLTNDIHKDRVAAVKKSMITSEKNVGGNVKGQAAAAAKAPPPAVVPVGGSPPKARES